MLEPRFFNVFRTAARGLEAQRIAMGTATENIANANTSREADGTPYEVKRAVHEATDDYTRFNEVLERSGANLQRRDGRHLETGTLNRRLTEMDLGPQTEVQEMLRERLEFDPDHPHADAEGYVHYPDINVVEEMSRVMSANRIYEANLTTVQAAKEMIKETLNI